MADPETRPNNTSTGRGEYLLDDHEVVRRGLRQLLGVPWSERRWGVRVRARSSQAALPFARSWSSLTMVFRTGPVSTCAGAIAARIRISAAC
jgi:hypothetical protein